MKRLIQSTIRSAHLWFAPPRPPDRIAIYFHELEGTDREAFAKALGRLRGDGYAFVGPAECVAPADDRQRVAFVSFDDNFRSWHDALPLFDELDLRATFYINTRPIRDTASRDEIEAYYRRVAQDPANREPLSRDEIRDLRSAGHTIGAHTHSHFDLSALARDQATDEILTSKRLLEEIIGEPVVHFAYPFGMRRHFSESLRDFCLESGFATVANAIGGLQFAGHTRAAIQRSPWRLTESVEHNLDNLRIDGRIFERLSGRTAVWS